MTTELVVRTGPQEYECSTGVLESLPERLQIRSIKKAVVLHGQVSWAKAQPYLTRLKESDLELWYVPFNGECTYEEVNRLAGLIREHQADAIIGVGGGKIMDTAKYAANLAKPATAVLIPTLASNCAPWTPLSVMYNQEGVCTGFDIFSQQASLLLIEPAIILDSPVNYFIAGVADTLAKWYESDKVLSLPENQRKVSLLMARAAASACRNVILDDTAQAVEDMKQHRLSDAFIRLTETIISTAGLVGGFGDKFARTTAAHDIHDALTIFPEVHSFLHGEKVGYGILAQLAMENNWEEIDQLLPFYRELSLPVSLSDLHLGHLKREDFGTFSDLVTAPGNGIHQLPYPVTKDTVLDGIFALETYLAEKAVLNSDTKQ